MGDFIHVEQLAANTVIGLFDWERRVRQTVFVDLTVRFDLRRAGVTDSIEDTLDYKTLTERVRSWIESSRYRLIETLACDVAALCLADPRVESVRATINKRGALRHAANVAVTVERAQGEETGRPAHQAYLGIGSNIDPTTNVRRALEMLQERFGAIRVSPVYRTAPVGAPDSPDFLNLAVGVRTDLDPEALSDVLHELEQACGRVRGSDRNAPRTMDLDLLLYDDAVQDGPPRLPHPQVLDAPFVLIPLAALAPRVIHPVSGKRLDTHRKALPVAMDGVRLLKNEIVY